MNKQNFNNLDLDKELEKKHRKKDKKKKQTMKVSGASLRNLSRIIKEKS
jgi:hypothetical protein